MVSVIIPNYCHARYLKQRIECVLAQTYPRWELVLVNARPENAVPEAERVSIW